MRRYAARYSKISAKHWMVSDEFLHGYSKTRHSPLEGKFLMKVYGIRNCDTVKKARKWLDDRGITYQFHDFKKDGLDQTLLTHWEQLIGWDTLINRRGTTWRKLPENVRDTITSQTARAIMLANPSIIKRPVVEHEGGVVVGFKANEWEALIQ
jgi:arsenate reductase